MMARVTQCLADFMGRGIRAVETIQCHQTFTRAQLDDAMKGIEWRRTDAFLDEIPVRIKTSTGSWPTLVGLVEIRHTLRQIVNVKGE
jgi:tRNA-splicing ligase RtcB